MTSTTTELRRSELATPASNERMFAKAAASDADMVFLDLEDACAPAMRESARSLAVDALRDLDWGRTVRAVRINSIDTVWCHDDIVDVVLGAGDALDVLIVPKVRRARDVWWVDVLLRQLELKMPRAHPVQLEVLIEETEGLANVDEIARSSPRLRALILGAGDLSASQRARVDTNFQPLGDYPGDFWHYARVRMLMAARSNGLLAIDAPYPAYLDPDGYRADAHRAALLGFDGKWAIHPSQVPIANAVFMPSEDDIAHARRLVHTYRDAEAQGRGASAMDGMLVDAAHLRHAENVLRLVGAANTNAQHDTRADGAKEEHHA
jgi:citrate lyase subunit beta/citryl-CoA lyase